MKKAFVLRLGAVTLGFTALCALAAQSARPEWYSIVPPLLAVSLALLTQKIILSLVVAVLAGGILSTVPLAPGNLEAWDEGILKSVQFATGSVTDPINLQILAFVILVMALISVILVAGGLQAFIVWLSRYARGPRSSQIVTALLGLAIFIDDYTNTMVVGSAMRPLSDRNRVSREKLAFVVDATSAPVSGLAVISTWIGYEVGLFSKASESLGLGKDGYSIFFDALPFRFYCILMIIFVLLSVFLDRDFGPMARAERRARETGAIAAPDAVPMTSRTFASAEADLRAVPRMLTAIFPMVALFGILLGGLWWDGGGFARGATDLLSFTAWREVISASENNILILAYAAAAALGVAIICALGAAKLTLMVTARAILSGVKASVLPLVILVLAWSLKAACDQLQTGSFLASVAGGALSPYAFPPILFVIAGMTAFATGTSWGTMAILIPTAAPLAFQLDGGSYGLTMMISLAAILDGAIFGDHCSPISDTTIMSSIASSCDHMHHVQTQLPYSLMVAGFALVSGYIPAAFGFSPWIGVAGAMVAMAGILLLSPRKTQVTFSSPDRAETGIPAALGSLPADR